MTRYGQKIEWTDRNGATNFVSVSPNRETPEQAFDDAIKCAVVAGWTAPKMVGMVEVARQTLREGIAAMSETSTSLPCQACGGEGNTYTSRYGGNDPDVWPTGPCGACNGSGDQTCENCEDQPATVRFKGHIDTYLLCQSCHDEWVKEYADD